MTASQFPSGLYSCLNNTSAEMQAPLTSSCVTGLFWKLSLEMSPHRLLGCLFCYSSVSGILAGTFVLKNTITNMKLDRCVVPPSHGSLKITSCPSLLALLPAGNLALQHRILRPNNFTGRKLISAETSTRLHPDPRCHCGRMYVRSARPAYENKLVGIFVKNGVTGMPGAHAEMQVVACACEVLCARDLLRLSDATITAKARPPNHRIMIRSTGKVHAMRHAFLN